MNASEHSRPPTRAGRVWALLAGLLIAVGLLGFTAGTVSAAGRAAAETRVGAFSSAAEVLVGSSVAVSPAQGRVDRPPQPQFVVAAGVAAETGSSLLARASGARDAELNRLTGVRSADRPATVVGAYNVRTGNVAFGSSSKVLQECAEAFAARNVGGDLGDIRLRRAFRPNGSGAPFREIPVCATYCEPAYGRGAFPDPLTKFESDAP